MFWVGLEGSQETWHVVGRVVQMKRNVGFWFLFDCILQSRHCPEWPCLTSNLPTVRTCANVALPSSSTCGAPSGTSSSHSSRHCRKPFQPRSMWPSSSSPTTSGRNRRPILAAPNSSLRWARPLSLTPFPFPFCHSHVSHFYFYIYDMQHIRLISQDS